MECKNYKTTSFVAVDFSGSIHSYIWPQLSLRSKKNREQSHWNIPFVARPSLCDFLLNNYDSKLMQFRNPWAILVTLKGRPHHDSKDCKSWSLVLMERRIRQVSCSFDLRKYQITLLFNASSRLFDGDREDSLGKDHQLRAHSCILTFFLVRRLP